MKLGFAGLGRMGSRMVEHLLAEGHEVVCYDPSSEAVVRAAEAGATPAASLEEVPPLLPPPRVVWVMVPAGAVAGEALERLARRMESGDVLADGGNSFFKDSLARATLLAGRGIRLLDVGTSGGLKGAAEGASLTVGGDAEAVELARPVLDGLAQPGGWAHVGPSGAGHFVKMVHNGIEYALEQAYGEGFELLSRGPFDLDLAKVGAIWSRGSVIRSWLLELAVESLDEDPGLSKVEGRIGGGETGAWAVETATELSVPVPLIALALMARYRSREDESFAAKVVSAVRHRFGGHAVAPPE